MWHGAFHSCRRQTPWHRKQRKFATISYSGWSNRVTRLKLVKNLNNYWLPERILPISTRPGHCWNRCNKPDSQATGLKNTTTRKVAYFAVKDGNHLLLKAWNASSVLLQPEVQNWRGWPSIIVETFKRDYVYMCNRPGAGTWCSHWITGARDYITFISKRFLKNSPVDRNR